MAINTPTVKAGVMIERPEATVVGFSHVKSIPSGTSVPRIQHQQAADLKIKINRDLVQPKVTANIIQ